MVCMALTDLGRRFGTWLGLEPDDLETVSTARNATSQATRPIPDQVMPENARLNPAHDDGSRPVAVSAMAPSAAFEREITELRRSVLDLRSGLGGDHEA
jgi:hypothetical protein